MRGECMRTVLRASSSLLATLYENAQGVRPAAMGRAEAAYASAHRAHDELWAVNAAHDQAPRLCGRDLVQVRHASAYRDHN